MEEVWINNYIELCGSVIGYPKFSHKSRGEEYFNFTVETERLSGVLDTVNVLARSDILRSLEIEEGKRLLTIGELRSFNNKSSEGNRLIINIFARDISFSGEPDKNFVHLVGALCKPPNYRKTPLGRDICDLMIAVTRRYGRSDYLPCIVWGQTAISAAEWEVGNIIQVIGRLQSRKYIKNCGDISVPKTAFEVSAVSAERI